MSSDFKVIIPCLVYSFELELKEVEHQNHIEERWQSTSSEFLEVLSSIDASDKQQIKGKLLGVVSILCKHTTLSCRLVT